MSKHRAIIIGAGRIGAGYKFVQAPFVYDHASTYHALRDRVELVGFVEPDLERAESAERKWKLPVYKTLADAPKADIYSVCTLPDIQSSILTSCYEAGAKGIWCEKPYRGQAKTPIPVQINYCRRFEDRHQKIKEIIENGKYGKIISFTVSAKKDFHTVCHLTDLARFWGVPKERFRYVDTLGTEFTNNEYELILEQRKYSFIEGGAFIQESGMWTHSKWWPGMTLPVGTGMKEWKPDFMVNALSNLLDVVDSVVVDGRDNLVSPPENAVESEKWANEILGANANG